MPAGLAFGRRRVAFRTEPLPSTLACGRRPGHLQLEVSHAAPSAFRLAVGATRGLLQALQPAAVARTGRGPRLVPAFCRRRLPPGEEETAGATIPDSGSAVCTLEGASAALAALLGRKLLLVHRSGLRGEEDQQTRMAAEQGCCVLHAAFVQLRSCGLEVRSF